MRTRCAFVLARDAEAGSSSTGAPRKARLPLASTTCSSAGWSARARPTTRRRCARPRRSWASRACRARSPCSSSCTRRAEHTWWSAVYEVRCTLPVAPQEAEIDWYAFLTEEELVRRFDGVAVDAGRARRVRAAAGPPGGGVRFEFRVRVSGGRAPSSRAPECGRCSVDGCRSWSAPAPACGERTAVPPTAGRSSPTGRRRHPGPG